MWEICKSWNLPSPWCDWPNTLRKLPRCHPPLYLEYYRERSLLWTSPSPRNNPASPLWRYFTRFGIDQPVDDSQPIRFLIRFIQISGITGLFANLYYLSGLFPDTNFSRQTIYGFWSDSAWHSLLQHRSISCSWAKLYFFILGVTDYLRHYETLFPRFLAENRSPSDTKKQGSGGSSC